MSDTSGSEGEFFAARLDAARTEPANVLVLRGPAGGGRTHLLDDLATRAVGWRVVRVKAARTERDLVYGGVSALLRRLAVIVPESEAACAELTGRFHHDEPGVTLARYDELLDCVETAASHAPLLVLVDDAHHLDDASAAAMTFAARRIEVPGLVVVFSVVDGADPRFEDDGLPIVELDQISAAAAVELVKMRTGRRMHASVAEVLISHVGGSPAKLVELAGELSDPHLAGWAALPMPLPAPQGVEAPELATVSAATRRALNLVSLTWVDSTEVIARALTLDELSLTDLESAEDAGLVEIDAGHVRFRDDVVRSVTAATASASERRSCHALLAEAISQRAPGEWIAQAHHLASGSLVGDDVLVALLRAIFGTAVADGDPLTAARSAAEAARWVAAGDPCAELLLDAAAQAGAVGASDWQHALLDEALRQAVGSDVRTRARVLRDHAKLTGGEPVAAMHGLLGQARSLAVVDPGSAARLYTVASSAAVAGGRIADGAAAARSALELAAAGSLPEAFAGAWVGICDVLAGDRRAGVELLDLHQTTVTAADLDEEVVWTRASILAARLYSDDVEGARNGLVQVVGELEGRGMLGWLRFPLAMLALAEHRRGWWDAAVGHASRVCRMSGAGDRGLLEGHGRIVLAVVAAARGEAEECLAHLAVARASAVRSGAELLIARVEAAEGLLALSLGDPARAVRHLEESERIAAGSGFATSAVLACAGDLVEACVAADLPARAAVRCERLEVEAEAEHGGRWADAVAQRGRALLDDAEAPALLERSASLLADLSMPFEQARSRLVGAEVHLRAGRAELARREASAAEDGLVALGAAPWVARARELITAIDRDVEAASPFASLTAQEQRVARLVADGASNREVADGLFLSTKTIEYHLHNIFRKLDLSTRRQLVRLAGDEASRAGGRDHVT